MGRRRVRRAGRGEWPGAALSDLKLLMATQSDNPRGGEGPAWFKAGQAVAGLEGVGRAGHRFGPESRVSACGT